MQYQRNVPLAPYTTFKVGGPAEYLVEVNTEVELVAVLQDAKEKSLPVTIIGGGSNVLVADEGVQGIVIINKISGSTFVEQGAQVTCTTGSGELLDKLVEESAARGYWGLENLSHIPGTVGATPIQNVGAYGVEVSSVIESVIAINKKTLEQNLQELYDYREEIKEKEKVK